MVIFPKAKINLGLNILRKRPDGFHDIESIFYPVRLFDALEIVANGKEAGEDILTVTGLFTGSNPSDNLVLKAVKKLRENFSFPQLKIHLHKKIPVGAGLGGGSSDAASALKTINRCYGLSLSTEELLVISAGLGSDCPFFINGQPAIASGRGEILQPVVPFLEGFYTILVNPGICISTKEAYEHCTPEIPSVGLNELVTYPVSEWKDLIINGFEKTIFKRYPQIAAIKRILYESGALYSSMSGSGATVYGIFSTRPSVPDKIKDTVIYEGLL